LKPPFSTVPSPPTIPLASPVGPFLPCAPVIDIERMICAL
jgi:hypothetical protein